MGEVTCGGKNPWRRTQGTGESPAIRSLAQRPPGHRSVVQQPLPHQRAGLVALEAPHGRAVMLSAARPLRDQWDYGPTADGKLPLRQRLAYFLLLATGVVLAVRFGWFWFSLTRLPRNFGSRPDGGDAVLFAALTFVIWHRQLIDMCSWLICTRVEAYRPAPPPVDGLRVAFITTFVPGSESIEMLERTLKSIVLADYPHDSWLLDEGDDRRARELCAQLGVKHFSRKGIESFNREKGVFLAKSKGGNHNAWYVSYGRDYDVVAQVDSDFLVRRDFLTRTLGHFRNPRIAFVGTPQIYGNVDNLVARGAAQQTYLFYGPILRALGRRKMALLIGANHVIRVAALQQIGWYQGHLTEDLATGKRFHAKRWQSVYVPLPLAVGEGPTSWADYFNQQYRWASGCIHIFFSQSPWLNAKMRRAHAFYYFLLEQFYFSGVSLAVAIMLLMLYFVFGWTAANVHIVQLAYWYVPLALWRQIMILWLQRFNVRPSQERGMLWAGRLVTVAAMPVYFMAFIGVLRKKRITFKTTPKGGEQSQELDRLSVFAPHMMIAGLLVSGMGLGVLLGHTVWVFMAWGTATSVLFSGLMLHLICRHLAAAARRRGNVLWKRHMPTRPSWKEVHHESQPAVAPGQIQPVVAIKTTTDYAV
jgi:cellulose synthase (UDP-forming)